MSEEYNQGSGGQDVATLGNRYKILMDKPLPHLDSPMAKAYAVTDSRASSRGMFGLVCQPNLLPRIDVIPQFSRMRRIPMLTPVDAGSVDLPGVAGRRFIIVFDLPTGERLIPSADSTIVPLREDQVVRRIIKPLMPALKEMASRSIRNRAIRADNLFYTDVGKKAAILGECVSNPPGMSQPILYEPIDAAMSLPSGRGSGTVSDDLYAFGVTLVVLLNGGKPVADLSDDEIVKRKIQHGSYSTLVGQMRVSLSIMEPLRGLLCDDAAERWTVADLELWLGGRQLSPKQPMLPTRASRSITFAGHEYWNRYALSYALGKNWREAGDILKNGELEGWIRRTYSDEDTAVSIAAAGGTDENLEQTVCRTLMVLQPQLPIRFKSFSARIEGVAQCFAAEYHDLEMRNIFIAMMRAKLPQIYLQSSPGSRTEQAVLAKSFDMINHFLERPKIGFGVERALYESNRGWPCQSPLIKDDYVCEVEDLLPALDRVAQRGATGEPMDRHIAAFAATRLKSLPDRTLNMLANANDLPNYRLGILYVLAEAQRADGTQQRYRHVSKWMGKLLEPVVEQFHNRAYRTQLHEEIERASSKGDLLQLEFLVDNAEARDQDIRGYEKARAEHANLMQGIAWLEDGGLTAPSRVMEKGQQAATVISAMISGVLIVALTVIYVI
jgi:eukaryotic-like serine/threonine-protein kinase